MPLTVEDRREVRRITLETMLELSTNNLLELYKESPESSGHVHTIGARIAKESNKCDRLRSLLERC